MRHVSDQLTLNKFTLYFEPMDEKHQVYHPVTNGDRAYDWLTTGFSVLRTWTGQGSRVLARSLVRITKHLIKAIHNGRTTRTRTTDPTR